MRREAELAHVDAAMFGRAAYQNPELLLDVDREFSASRPVSPFEALEVYFDLCRARTRTGRAARRYDAPSARPVRRPAGRRMYRQRLSTSAPRQGAGLAALREAVAAVSRSARVAAE